MKKIWIIFIILVLVGCEQNYYSKKGVTGEKMAKDLFDCAVEIGKINNTKISIHRLEQLCMKAKGYNVHTEKPKNFEDATKD